MKINRNGALQNRKKPVWSVSNVIHQSFITVIVQKFIRIVLVIDLFLMTKEISQRNGKDMP